MSKVGSRINNLSSKLRGNSLKAKAARGSLILATGTVIERAMRLVRNMILARLLMPSEFGIMAIIMATMCILEAFAELGIRQSVIHHKEGCSLEYLNVAWWFQVVRGIVLFLMAYIAAPWISEFYNNTDLVNLLRVAFVAALFESFISPRIHALNKKVQFGKIVILTQGSGLFGTLVSLAIALFVVCNIWALVIGIVAEAAFKFLLSFLLCPFLPKLSIDKQCLIDVFEYTRKMFGVAILAAISFQFDVLVLGKISSEEQLGMYSLALLLATQPNMFFSRVISPVLLPMFAEKQDDRQLICQWTKKMTHFMAFFGVPIITFMVICANPLLSVVWGTKYSAVAIPFGLLCIQVFLRMQASFFSQIYFAIGKPHLHRRFLILRLIILALLMYPCSVEFGIVGAAAVMLIANLIALCMQVVWVKESVGLYFGDYANCWVPGLKLAVIVLVPTILVSLLYKEIIVLNIIVGSVSCLIACLIGFFWKFKGKTDSFFE